MHVSMKELMRLKLRSKIYSPFIGIGIISFAFGIVMGLRYDDPLVIGSHTYLLIGEFFQCLLESYCIRMKKCLLKNMT